MSLTQSSLLKNHSNPRIVILGFSVGCVAVSAFLLLSLPLPPSFPPEWRSYSFGFLAAAAAISFGLSYSSNITLSLVLLLARLVLVVLIGIPAGDWMAFKVPLWASLILDSAACLEIQISVVAQAFSLFVVMLFQRPILAWGMPVHGASFAQLVIACAGLAGLGVLLFFLRKYSAIIASQAEQAARLDEAVGQLTLANLGFQRLAYSAEGRSAEDERKRITREIHDAIGYALTNLIMMMEAAMRLAPEDASKLRELLGQAREEAQVGLMETRKALRVLRATMQEPVRGLSAVHRLVTLFSAATGVEVRTEYCNADQSYGNEADRVLYRMIQEGITNAFRHGHATLITLKFWQDETGVRVTISDNGVGTQSVKEGLGLQGMRERIEKLEGTLTVQNPADGFELTAWLPLRRTAATEERNDAGEQDLIASG